MSIEKSLLKASAHRDTLSKLDQMASASQQQIHVNRGGKQAMDAAVKSMAEYQGPTLNKLLDQEKITPDEHALLKQHFTHAVLHLEKMGKQMEASIAQTEGKMSGLLSAMEMVKKLFEAEDQRIRAASVLEDEGDVPDLVDSGIRRTPGVRPAKSVAQLRRGQAPGEVAPEAPQGEQNEAGDELVRQSEIESVPAELTEAEKAAVADVEAESAEVEPSATLPESEPVVKSKAKKKRL